MPQLLVATTNHAKFKEFKDILASHDIACQSLTDLNITDRPIEDGESFAENSLLKSNFYWQRTHQPVLADDGGLEIDALGGQPGVHSRRIDGQERTDAEAVSLILEKVRAIPAAKRTARMKTVVTLRIDKDRNFQAESSVAGLIKNSTLDWEPGFPYRAIFWVPKYKKFLSELSADELTHIGHRRDAIEQLLPYLQQYL